MTPIIEIRKVSKRYRLRNTSTPYLSLRDTISSIFKSKSKYEHIDVLKDVDFELEHGDTLGIIGKNGAGKSTLLKVLSRITPPTTGEIILRGRVASLLEVGTGFHPELSGRENIFLNGSILGMSKHEIKRRFDEIVEFSGVDRYIDTPLKFYSSGMQLRLAFAVSAHLEPEIMIIDEVLAVGDAEFQKKCMGKMEDVSKSGRTILFVSHNMASIRKLCKKCVVLNKGTTNGLQDTDSAISEYLSMDNLENYEWNLENSGFSSKATIEQIIVIDAESQRLHRSIKTNDKIGLQIEFILHNPCPNLIISVGILDQQENVIFASSAHDCKIESPKKPGQYTARIHFPEGIFMPLKYIVRVVLWSPTDGLYHSVTPMSFTVERDISPIISDEGGRSGVIAVLCNWTLGKRNSSA